MAGENPRLMQWKLLKLLGGALLVSTLLTARTPAKAQAPTTPKETSPEVIFDSTSSIAMYISNQAEIIGVDKDMALYIANHESSYNPQAIGDHGHSRGVWQINDIWNPSISDDCAYSVTCSTAWAIKQIKDGKENIWSTWRLRCELFKKDCFIE